jgi:hypothetical protein
MEPRVGRLPPLQDKARSDLGKRLLEVFQNVRGWPGADGKSRAYVKISALPLPPL